MLFTEKNPLIIFPNKIIKNLKKHVFVKVIIQSFSGNPIFYKYSSIYK